MLGLLLVRRVSEWMFIGIPSAKLHCKVLSTVSIALLLSSCDCDWNTTLKHNVILPWWWLIEMHAFYVSKPHKSQLNIFIFIPLVSCFLVPKYFFFESPCWYVVRKTISSAFIFYLHEINSVENFQMHHIIHFCSFVSFWIYCLMIKSMGRENT